MPKNSSGSYKHFATVSVEQRELLALKRAGELSAREIGALTEVRGPWRLPVPLPSIAQP